MTMASDCKVNECGHRQRKHFAKGMCVKCYWQAYSKEPEKIKARRERRYAGNYKRSQRNWKLQKNFGITINDYEKLLEIQNGVCDICGNKEKTKRNGNEVELAVDHNHKTGLVRGLLCRRCNTIIGLSEESNELLKKIIEYINRVPSTLEV